MFVNSLSLYPLSFSVAPLSHTFSYCRAVLEPLADLPRPVQSVYVLVDSLDSGFGAGLRDGVAAAPTASQSGSIAELLSRHLHLLPSWLLLVCSARRQNKTICKMFSGTVPTHSYPEKLAHTHTRTHTHSHTHR